MIHFDLFSCFWAQGSGVKFLRRLIHRNPFTELRNCLLIYRLKFSSIFLLIKRCLLTEITLVEDENTFLL